MNESASQGLQKASPEGEGREAATRLITAVAGDAIRLAIMRSSLEWDKDTEDTEDDIVADAVGALLGDETCSEGPTPSTEKLLAALRQSAAPSGGAALRETAWLIEREDQQWAFITDDRRVGWSSDSLKALRFARKEDAEVIASLLDLYITQSGLNVTEHIWS